MIQSTSRIHDSAAWPRTQLKDVVVFRSGHRDTNSATADGEFPFFVCSSEVLRSSDFDFDEEAVIMAGNNADGVFHLHHFKGKFAARQRTYVMTPSTKQLDCQYLFLQLGRLQKTFQAAAIGTTTQYVTIEMLRRAEIPVPKLETQRAIAYAVSDMDGLVEALDRLIVKKLDLKQATMQQLLTGKTRLTGFSGDWKVKTLGDLFMFSGGYSASRDQLSTEGHCYLHYGDIHGSSKTSIDTQSDYLDIPKLDIPLKRISSSSMLQHGDVVFVDASEDDAGTSKHLVVMNRDNIPFISGLHTIVAKSKTEELAHEYRHYCFQSAAIRQQFLFYSVGTKVSGISKTNIPKLTIPVPPIREQTAIARVLSDLDAELAALRQRRDKTRALKQAMMQELLTDNTKHVLTAGQTTKDYEDKTKRLFIDEPANLKLLIVVSKLLTGFDAPSCSYVYLDNELRDHNLFQAICRTNRLDGDDKDYGHIVDFKELFENVQNSIAVYTSDELDIDERGDDGNVIVKDWLKEGKAQVDAAREALRYLCEPVAAPREMEQYLHHTTPIPGRRRASGVAMRSSAFSTTRSIGA